MKHILLLLTCLLIQLVSGVTIISLIGGVVAGGVAGMFMIMVSLTALYLGANFVDVEYGLSQKDKA